MKKGIWWIDLHNNMIIWRLLSLDFFFKCISVCLLFGLIVYFSKYVNVNVYNSSLHCLENYVKKVIMPFSSFCHFVISATSVEFFIYFCSQWLCVVLIDSNQTNVRSLLYQEWVSQQWRNKPGNLRFRWKFF